MLLRKYWLREMSDIVKKTLAFAFENDKPVIVCYMSGDDITQRRIYVRRIEDNKITVYCTAKRALRFFKPEGILSAQLADM